MTTAGLERGGSRAMLSPRRQRPTSSKPSEEEQNEQLRGHWPEDRQSLSSGAGWEVYAGH